MTRKLNSVKDNTFVPTIAYKQSPLTTTLFLEKVTIKLTRPSPQALVIFGSFDICQGNHELSVVVGCHHGHHCQHCLLLMSVLKIQTLNFVKDH